VRKVGVLAEISFKAKADALNRKIGFEGLSLVRSNAGSRLRIRRRLLSEQKTNNGQHIRIRIWKEKSNTILLVKEDVDITTCREISRGATRLTLPNDCPIHGQSSSHGIGIDEYQLQ